MNKSFRVKEIAIIGIFTAITILLAQIAIPLPFYPAPVSFGLVAVYLSGILLNPKHAVVVQLCYLLLGAVGLPVFGGFRGGLGALFGPTGGYLMMYPIMAWIVSMPLNSKVSLQIQTGEKQTYIKAAMSLVIAQIVLYLGGTVWLSITTASSFIRTLALAVYPFVPLDIFKVIFCIAVFVPLRQRLLWAKLLPVG